MSNIFSIAEAVDLGIEKEKKRREFYDLVSKEFEAQKELKELFTQLRDWEDGHVQKFTDIRNSVENKESVDSYSGELQEYMKAFIDNHLYNEISADMFKNKKFTLIEVINYGIGFEKDSILFFSELVPYVGSSNKEVIQQLINEEKKHILYLIQLKLKMQ